MMIINTRPEKQSAQLKILADDEGIEIRHIHLSQTKFKNLASNSIQKLENISSYKNIIFTSQNSVINGLKILESFWRIDLLNHNFLTTGPATSNKLLKKGIKSVFPDNFSSKGVLNLVRNNFPGKSLLFCGDNSNGFLQKELGEDIEEIVCYEINYLIKEVKKITKDREIILIYNFGTIEFLINHLNNDILENKVFVVASENIKQKIENESKRLEIYVSSKPTDKMMMSMAKNFI